eukprot:TRINITY_DN14688_c0_g1_i1.p1 TRINITY_DN14688_c0_g1~~TRINITY_DN14688_c0_g1_i1.p1  ORF type:complete len:431 (+),score=50.34 TRINITY_DN14688_c0_g1_i1:70-1362(+)
MDPYLEALEQMEMGPESLNDFGNIRSSKEGEGETQEIPKGTDNTQSNKAGPSRSPVDTATSLIITCFAGAALSTSTQKKQNRVLFLWLPVLVGTALGVQKLKTLIERKLLNQCEELSSNLIAKCRNIETKATEDVMTQALKRTPEQHHTERSLEFFHRSLLKCEKQLGGLAPNSNAVCSLTCIKSLRKSIEIDIHTSSTTLRQDFKTGTFLWFFQAALFNVNMRRAEACLRPALTTRFPVCHSPAAYLHRSSEGTNTVCSLDSLKRVVDSELLKYDTDAIFGRKEGIEVLERVMVKWRQIDVGLPVMEDMGFAHGGECRSVDEIGECEEEQKGEETDNLQEQEYEERNLVYMAAGLLPATSRPSFQGPTATPLQAPPPPLPKPRETTVCMLQEEEGECSSAAKPPGTGAGDLRAELQSELLAAFRKGRKS